MPHVQDERNCECECNAQDKEDNPLDPSRRVGGEREDQVGTNGAQADDELERFVEYISTRSTQLIVLRERTSDTSMD